MALCTRAGLAMILLFSAGGTAGLKIGSRAAQYAVLHHVYGPQAVAQQHLRIVDGKPGLHVSNGDVLRGYDFACFAITALIFVAVAIVLLALSVALLPQPLRREVNRVSQRNSEGPGFVPLVVFLPVAAWLLLTQSLWPNVIVLGVVLLLARWPRIAPARIDRI